VDDEEQHQDDICNDSPESANISWVARWSRIFVNTNDIVNSC
jgi:siroheme synthase (precorrin-2 oxidase/ferrochelatase)